MLAPDEMCSEGMGAVGKGVGDVGTGWNEFCRHRESCKGSFRCWCRVNRILRAWEKLKRGFEVLALGEISFEGMGGGDKGVSGVCAG